MTPQPLHPPFAQPFHQPYAAPVHPVAHDPWRWLLGPAAHAVTVVLLGLVLAIWATAAGGDLGLVPSLLQSGLGVMGTPFSLSATVLDDTAPPAATAAVLVVTALVWVVPHAAVAYWRATR